MGFDSPMKGKCYQARGKGWEATNTTQKLLHSRLPKKAIALMGSWPRNPGGTAFMHRIPWAVKQSLNCLLCILRLTDPRLLA
jgi:hypothetical protein